MDVACCCFDRDWFIFDRKKVAIREMFGDLKKELAESVNSLIDRINKR